jgi:hypothetical protein
MQSNVDFAWWMQVFYTYVAINRLVLTPLKKINLKYEQLG